MLFSVDGTYLGYPRVFCRVILYIDQLEMDLSIYCRKIFCQLQFEARLIFN
jgi:hypothetical protein